MAGCCAQLKGLFPSRLARFPLPMGVDASFRSVLGLLEELAHPHFFTLFTAPFTRRQKLHFVTVWSRRHPVYSRRSSAIQLIPWFSLL